MRRTGLRVIILLGSVGLATGPASAQGSGPGSVAVPVDRPDEGLDAVDSAVRTAQASARPGGFPGALRPAVPNSTLTAPGPRPIASLDPGAASTSPGLFGRGDGGATARALGTFGRVRASQMLGDLGPPALRASPRQVVAVQPPSPPPPFPPNGPPETPDPRRVTGLVPSVRGFKIGENQSPQPQDRVFYSFNYFANVNDAVNRRFEAPVDNLRVYRHIFGFEKTFDDGYGSVGLRLPLNTLVGRSNVQGDFAKLGGTSTALGDLSIFAKYVLKVDPETGSLLSAGLVVTPPTGPRTFANSNFVQGLHTTTLQPFIGYLVNRGDFYLHGFAAFDAPINPREATLFYSDTGIGYYLLRAEPDDADSVLTAVAPTFEVHCNIPLNHRGAFNQSDISGSADVVNLTYGVNFEFRRRSVLTLGFVNPVTSPRPFDFEALVLFNFRFGGSRIRPQNLPILGG